MKKIKPLTKEQILISLDRLTRFKYPQTKYVRVFEEIVLNNLIIPKYKKSELEVMDSVQLRHLSEDIINFSLLQMGFGKYDDYSINDKIYEIEDNTFILTKESKELLKNKINYKACCQLIDENSPDNLKWLKSLAQNNIDIKRCKFPIEKIVISEGITEEILLPKFAGLYGYDFDENHVNIISAGGKNQVVKLFYQLSEICRLPIFILLDSDAQANKNEILPKLRNCDNIYLIQKGEFEDILPSKLIKKTLAYIFNNISIVEEDILNSDDGMVKILTGIFRHRGMHEFKKSNFAQVVRECICSRDDISQEIKKIIDKIRDL